MHAAYCWYTAMPSLSLQHITQNNAPVSGKKFQRGAGFPEIFLMFFLNFKRLLIWFLSDCLKKNVIFLRYKIDYKYFKYLNINNITLLSLIYFLD